MKITKVFTLGIALLVSALPSLGQYTVLVDDSSNIIFPTNLSSIPAAGLTGTVPTNTLPGLLSGLSVGDGSWLTSLPSTTPLNLVVLGDSRSLPTGSSWANLISNRTTINGITVLSNLAVAGSTVSNVAIQFTNSLVLSPTNTGVPCVLAIWVGVNDYSTVTIPTLFSTLSNITVQAIAAGYKVMMFTEPGYHAALPGYPELFEAENIKLRAFSTNFYRLIDTAVMLGNPATNEVYSDAVHLTAPASMRLAEYVEWTLLYGYTGRNSASPVTILSPPWENRLRKTGDVASNLTVNGTFTIAGETYRGSSTWLCTNLSYSTITTGFTFNTYYTYAKIQMQAAGGPGGSGRVGAAGSVRTGGGSGSGGAYSEDTFSIAELVAINPSWSITLGCRGVGGIAQTSDDSDGVLGVAAASSFFYVTNGTNAILYCQSGGRGHAGTTGAGVAPTATLGLYAGGAGIASSATGLVGLTGTPIANGRGAPSGGTGGGITTGNADSAGGNGGALYSLRATGVGGIGGTAGNPGENSWNIIGLVQTTVGPGGGGSKVGGNGGAGGSGGWGAGGAGGGAADNGNDSGPGGDGGGSWIRVTQFR